MWLLRYLFFAVMLSLFAIVLLLFLGQNQHTEQLSFFGLEYATNLVWELLGAAAFGVFMALVLLLPGRLAGALHSRRLERELRELEHDLLRLQDQREHMLARHELLLDTHERVLQSYQRLVAEHSRAIVERDRVRTQLAATGTSPAPTTIREHAAREQVTAPRLALVPPPPPPASSPVSAAPVAVTPPTQAAPIAAATVRPQPQGMRDREVYSPAAQVDTPTPPALPSADHIHGSSDEETREVRQPSFSERTPAVGAQAPLPAVRVGRVEAPAAYERSSSQVASAATVSPQVAPAVPMFPASTSPLHVATAPVALPPPSAPSATSRRSITETTTETSMSSNTNTGASSGASVAASLAVLRDCLQRVHRRLRETSASTSTLLATVRGTLGAHLLTARGTFRVYQARLDGWFRRGGSEEE